MRSGRMRSGGRARKKRSGRTLWQIGVAARSSGEFKRGDDVRHYDNFIRYAADFPNDVTFIIGRSREGEDWNFAQWGWYVKKPYWSILFDQPEASRGKATLTLGYVGWEYRRPLTVTVNGHEVGRVALRKSGEAVYRSGGQDSLYQVAYVPFDASL